MYRLLVCLLLIGCAETLPSDEASDTNPESTLDLDFGTRDHFDVITWNIETFPKHSRTVEYVVESLKALQPDAVAIQEVWDVAAIQSVQANLPNFELYLPPDIEDTGLAWLYNSQTLNLVRPGYQIFEDDNYDFSYRPPTVIEVTFKGQSLVLMNLHLKCCGDGWIGEDYWDEERRRKNASIALKEYISQQLGEKKVIVLGDWNDAIEEPAEQNVFWDLIQDSDAFRFTDMNIATGDSTLWSFPTYPSHLDHILISNELFEAFDKPSAKVQTILIEDALPGGWNEYSLYLSDHRPVGLQLQF